MPHAMASTADSHATLAITRAGARALITPAFCHAARRALHARAHPPSAWRLATGLRAASFALPGTTSVAAHVFVMTPSAGAVPLASHAPLRRPTEPPRACQVHVPLAATRVITRAVAPVLRTQIPRIAARLARCVRLHWAGSLRAVGASAARAASREPICVEAHACQTPQRLRAERPRARRVRSRRTQAPHATAPRVDSHATQATH